MSFQNNTVKCLVQSFVTVYTHAGMLKAQQRDSNMKSNDAEEAVLMYVYQVNPDFEEENAEQRPSVSKPDRFPPECSAMPCWLPHCY